MSDKFDPYNKKLLSKYNYNLKHILSYEDYK